ncbi:hypothetical protein ACN28S_41120 [Cystobacter fuscus]
MSRLIFFVLIQLGARLVLRRLWPEVRVGWRRRVLLGLAVFSGVALVLPWLLGHGTHGGVPWVDAPLRLFGSAWTISALIVLLLGWPLALVLSRRELARQKRAADPAAPPLPGGSIWSGGGCSRGWGARCPSWRWGRARWGSWKAARAS